MKQSINTPVDPARGDSGHQPQPAESKWGRLAALAGLAWCCLGAPLSAQSRATLQVAAQVVQITPSAVALGQARDLAGQGAPGSWTTPLATIVVAGDSVATQRRAARVVTIEYLSN